MHDYLSSHKGNDRMPICQRPIITIGATAWQNCWPHQKHIHKRILEHQMSLATSPSSSILCRPSSTLNRDFRLTVYSRMAKKTIYYNFLTRARKGGHACILVTFLTNHLFHSIFSGMCNRVPKHTTQHTIRCASPKMCTRIFKERQTKPHRRWKKIKQNLEPFTEWLMMVC